MGMGSPFPNSVSSSYYSRLKAADWSSAVFGFFKIVLRGAASLMPFWGYRLGFRMGKVTLVFLFYMGLRPGIWKWEKFPLVFFCFMGLTAREIKTLLSLRMGIWQTRGYFFLCRQEEVAERRNLLIEIKTQFKVFSSDFPRFLDTTIRPACFIRF